MNQELIEQFNILNNYYRLQNDKGRSIAYSKAVSGLRTVDGKISSLTHVQNIRGVGPKIKEKIKEYLDTGKIQIAEKAKREMNVEKTLSKKQKIKAEFETIWGIGPAKADKLYNDGIRSLKSLEKNTHLLTDQQKIGLKHREDLLKKVPRNLITALLVIIKLYLNEKWGRNSYKIEIAGSYRRGMQESGDIDCLITSKVFTLQQAVKLLKEKKIVTDILSMRNEKFMGVVACPSGGQHIRLDIEFIKENEWGTALLYFTGSKGFNVYMRAEAKRKGMLLNEHGLYDSFGKEVLSFPDEEDVFQAIGMKYTKPENR